MRNIKSLLILIILIGLFSPNNLFAKEEAVFLLSPNSGNYNQGDEFSINLKLNSSGPVTSIKSYLKFDPAAIKVENIDTTGAFTYWWENIFDNKTGKIQLQASAAAPGIKEGLIAKINFQSIKNGTAEISFESTSLALKADDEDILNLAASVGAEFTIDPASPISIAGSKNILLIIFGVLLVVIIIVFIQKKKLIKI
jgi:hypothetical protein